MLFQIKEVAAPYTSTPELRRFWEHDIRLVRDKNISRDNSSLDSSYYDGLSKTKQKVLERTLNEAVREAIDDETFRKVQRMSYGHGAEEITPKLGLPMHVAVNNGDGRSRDEIIDRSTSVDRPSNGLPDSTSTNEDLEALDRLITYLLGQPISTANNNLDTWRRSRQASARGYRQLYGTGAAAEAGNIGTTPF